MTEDWISTVEAAALTGYDVSQIRRLASKKRIKAKKWLRDWQISRSSLLEYIETAESLGEKRGPKRK